MLSIQNLVRRFGTDPGQPAGGVFGLNLEVEAGEIFTLLGPSGCGKTTTLRCVAGLDHLDAGRIALDGRELFNSESGKMVPMYDRNIGMVFQSYAIWPHMSVFENAAYPLRVARGARLSRAEIDKRVNGVLGVVGLERYGDRSATKLSGGQQQRLALARALVREPKLLLLDEPLSNLDAQLREQMRGEIKRIQREWGVTTIYVTHDQGEAMAMSDRVAVMNQGRLMQLGAPEDLYERPQSEFVAKFLGRTNLLHGTLESGVAAGEIGLVQTEIGPMRCRFPNALAGGQSMSFVIRPENIELQPLGGNRDAAGENTVDGTVTNRLYLGDIAEYTVDLDGRFNLLVRVRPGLSLGSDGRVRVRLPAESTFAIG